MVMIDLALKIFIFLLLITISVFDIRKMIIPDTFVISVFVLSLVFLLLTKPVYAILYRMLFSLIVMGSLFLVSKLTKGFGAGDVKLCSALSFAQGFSAFFITLFLSSIFGIVYSLVRFKKSKNNKIPFAPFLAAGFLTSEVAGGVVAL